MAHSQNQIIREQLTALFQEQTLLKTRITDRFEVIERRQQEGQSIMRSLQQARLEIEPALEKRFSDALQRELAGLREGAGRMQQAMSEEIGSVRSMLQQESGSREEIHSKILTRLDEHQEGLAKQDEIHAQHRQEREDHAGTVRDHVQSQVAELTESITRESQAHGEKHEEHAERAEQLASAKARIEDRLAELEKQFLAEREQRESELAQRDGELKKLRGLLAAEKRTREEEAKTNEDLFAKEAKEREAKIEQVKRNRAAWVKDQFGPLQDRLQVVEKSMREVVDDHKVDVASKHDALRGEVRKLEERHQTAVKEFKGERMQREALHDDVQSHKFTREELEQRVEALEQRLREECTTREISGTDLGGRLRAQKDSQATLEDGLREERRARAMAEELLEQHIREASATAAQLHDAAQADLLNERQLREADDGKLQERCRELQAIVLSHEDKHVEHKNLVHEVAGRSEMGMSERLEMIEASVLTLDERVEKEAKDRELATEGLWDVVEGRVRVGVRSQQVARMGMAGAPLSMGGSVATQPPISPVSALGGISSCVSPTGSASVAAGGLSPFGSMRVPPANQMEPIAGSRLPGGLSPGGSLRAPVSPTSPSGPTSFSSAAASTMPRGPSPGAPNPLPQGGSFRAPSGPGASPPRGGPPPGGVSPTMQRGGTTPRGQAGQQPRGVATPRGLQR